MCNQLALTLNLELMLSNVSFLAKLPATTKESAVLEVISLNRLLMKWSLLVVTSCSKLACKESLFFSKNPAWGSNRSYVTTWMGLWMC